MRHSALLLICGLPIFGQINTPETERPSIRVHGESQISAQPDQAEIDIGVVTQGATGEAVTRDNARKVAAVIQGLRAALPSAPIKTVNVSINPSFRYPKEGAPTIQGYTASDTVRVILGDLITLGTAINIALKGGASSVNRLNFTMRSQSEREIRAKALGEAAAQATGSAEAIASSLKLKLGRILHVEEGQPIVISPAPQIDLGTAQSSDLNSLTPGYIQVHANVNVTYELIQ